MNRLLISTLCMATVLVSANETLLQETVKIFPVVTSAESIACEEEKTVDNPEPPTETTFNDSIVKYSAETENYYIEVNAEQNIFPENTEFYVSELSPDDEIYISAYEQIAEENDDSIYFSALDICFLYQGEKTEPDGIVNVSIELKNISEEETPENIEIYHIPDDTMIPELMESYQEESVISFETDSFSTYTVYWRNGNTNMFGIQCNYVDEDGTAINGNSGSRNITISANSSAKTYFYPADYAVDIDEYEFVEAQYNGKPVSYITGYRNTWGYGYATVFYTDGNSSSLTRTGGTVSVPLNFIYKQSSKLRINDTVLNNGLFSAVLTDDTEHGTVSYTWYRRIAGSSDEWEEVTIDNSIGSVYNLPYYQTSSGYRYDNTENWINVVYDRTTAKKTHDLETGEILEYMVKAVDSYGNEYTSSAVTVPYYDDIMNGDFEIPVISGDTNKQLPCQTIDGIYWKTTASDKNIEIIRPSYNSGTAIMQYGSGISSVHDSQCAEILAEASGALYQDLITIPGTVMNWELYHLARSGNYVSKNSTENENSMYVLPVNAEWFITENDREYLLLNGDANPKYDLSSSSSIAALRNVLASGSVYGAQLVESDASGLTYHFGTYTVPEEQFVTRFLFLSVEGSTTSGGVSETMGNIIDDVRFSTELPRPTPNTAVLKVKKIVTGLTAEELEDYHVEMTVYLENSTTIAEMIGGNIARKTLSGFSSPANYTANADGTVTAELEASFVFSASNAIQYYVTESMWGEPPGVTVSSSNETVYYLDSNGTAPVTQAQSGTRSDTVVVNNTSSNVVFRNDYAKNKLILTKVILGTAFQGEYVFYIYHQNYQEGDAPVAEVILNQDNNYYAELDIASGDYVIVEKTDEEQISDTEYGFSWESVEYASDSQLTQINEKSVAFSVAGTEEVSITAKNNYYMPVPAGIHDNHLPVVRYLLLSVLLFLVYKIAFYLLKKGDYDEE